MADTKSLALRHLSGPTSTYASLITQQIALVPTFTLESGPTLHSVPVAYKTWGRLNSTGTNCLVICHALTGSADVEDWWGPLLGKGKAFDPTRYFIFCANVIGSPYGTVSSVTVNPETGRVWGPELAGSCPKDDVRLHKLVLDSLGVTSVAAVIGGSMGGMTTLEYPLNTPPGYVRHIVPLATSARHSAWCISWGEAQRQSIYSDPAYGDGYYCYSDEESGSEEEEDGAMEERSAIGVITVPTDPEEFARQVIKERERQPIRGLAAARMAALLTYRSRDSFESRFGRKFGAASGVAGSGRGGRGGGNGSGKGSRSGASTPVMGGAPGNGATGGSDGESSPREDAWKAHNDGLRQRESLPGKERKSSSTPLANSIDSLSITSPSPAPNSPGPIVLGTTESTPSSSVILPPLTNLDLSMPSGTKLGSSAEVKDALKAVAGGAGTGLGTGASRQPQVFSAQSYLRYQGDKFTSRFDANCYIHITRKMDMHDISQPSTVLSDPPTLSTGLPQLDDNCSEAEQTGALIHALSLLPPALVIGIETDGLFTTREQRELANTIPEAELVIIPSPDGHDGFLLEFEAINKHVSEWLKRRMPEVYAGDALVTESEDGANGFGVKKESLFGEAEADITRW